MNNEIMRTRNCFTLVSISLPPFPIKGPILIGLSSERVKRQVANSPFFELAAIELFTSMARA